MSALDEYVQAVAHRLPAYREAVAAARAFLQERGVSLRFLTHVLWNGGMTGAGEYRSEIVRLCDFVRDRSVELSRLEGAAQATRATEPLKILDGFLLRNLHPLKEYPAGAAAQVRDFMVKHWGADIAEYLLAESEMDSVPVARLVTMTAQWCSPARVATRGG